MILGAGPLHTCGASPGRGGQWTPGGEGQGGRRLADPLACSPARSWTASSPPTSSCTRTRRWTSSGGRYRLTPPWQLRGRDALPPPPAPPPVRGPADSSFRASTPSSGASPTREWPSWRPWTCWMGWWTSRTQTWTSLTPSTPSRRPRAYGRPTPTRVRLHLPLPGCGGGGTASGAGRADRVPFPCRP